MGSRDIYPIPPAKMFRYTTEELDWADAELLEVGSSEIRPGPYAYNRLKLIGHSLGAVVVRYLIQDCARDWEAELVGHPDAPPPPMLSAQLSLFAPAHLGVALSGLPSVGVGVLERLQLGIVISR
jgi:hypothetical protein